MPIEISPRSRRVHVVEDEDEIREAIRVLLSTADVEAVGFPSAEAFITSDGETEAHCILLDNNLPGMSGLSLLKRLKEAGSKATVIMITGRGDVPTAVDAMRNGAFHFLEKPFDPDVLIGLVEEGVARASALTPDLTDMGSYRLALQTLSEREREVHDLMIQGVPNKVLAHRLSISVRTVEHHRANVMRKLDMRSLSHLIRAAMAVKN
jgi:FixJ family two-component response regulator